MIWRGLCIVKIPNKPPFVSRRILHSLEQLQNIVGSNKRRGAYLIFHGVRRLFDGGAYLKFN